jgi:hypothetical protein
MVSGLTWGLSKVIGDERLLNSALNAFEFVALADKPFVVARLSLRPRIIYQNRIREEMPRFRQTASKSFLERVLSFLSNGFVLLVVGTLLTSILVPMYQRHYDLNKKRVELMQECLSQFLLYSNSIWQEYYSLFPIADENDVNHDEYNMYLDKISEIKLRRYDAFARLQATAIVFRTQAQNESDVERALYEFAVEINNTSTKFDTWLRKLYCYRARCPGEDIPADYSPNDGFSHLRREMAKMEGRVKRVSTMMVQQIGAIE